MIPFTVTVKEGHMFPIFRSKFSYFQANMNGISHPKCVNRFALVKDKRVTRPYCAYRRYDENYFDIKVSKHLFVFLNNINFVHGKKTHLLFKKINILIKMWYTVKVVLHSRTDSLQVQVISIVTFSHP